MSKVDEILNRKEAQTSVMITGEPLQRILEAHRVYECEMDALKERHRVFHEELNRDRERAYERVNLVVNQGLQGSDLIGRGPEEVELILDFATKHGFAIAKLRDGLDEDGKPAIIRALEKVFGPATELSGDTGTFEVHLGDEDEEKK